MAYKTSRTMEKEKCFGWQLMRSFSLKLHGNSLKVGNTQQCFIQKLIVGSHQIGSN